MSEEPKPFLIGGTALVVAGVVLLAISNCYSNLEQDKRDEARALDAVVDERTHSYSTANGYRSTALLLYTRYDTLTQMLHRELRRNVSGAILNMAHAAGHQIDDDTTEEHICETLGSYSEYLGCLDDLLSKASEEVSRLNVESAAATSAADDRRRKARLFQYLAHFSQALAIVLLMIKDLAHASDRPDRRETHEDTPPRDPA